MITFEYKHNKGEVEEITAGRIWGGIGWPGERAGHACVIAEDRYREPVKGKYRLFLIAEYAPAERKHLFDKDKILRWCSQATRSRMRVDTFFANLSDENAAYIEEWNNRLRPEGWPEVRIDQCPHAAKNLSYVIDMVNHVTAPEAPYFYILRGTGDLFRAQWAESPSVTDQLQEKDCPAIAATAYAITALHEYSRDLHDTEEDEWRDPNWHVNLDSATGY